MPVRWSLYAMVALFCSTISVSAQTISVNGDTPPATVSTGVAAGLTVSVTGGPGNTTDWIALYHIGAPDNAPVSWNYLSGTTTPPSSGLTAASFTAYAPLTADDYEFRLFANDGWIRIATSAVITVAASGAVLTVNGVTAPTAATAQAGSTLNVSVVNGPGNATDWFALAPAGSVDGTVLDWRYLNGATVPPGSGSTSGSAQFVAPAAAGDYEIRLFAHDSYSRVATSALTVSMSSAALMVNDTAPPMAVSVVAGTYVTVDITGGPAAPGDWVGLYTANAADNAPMSWKYLNGSTTLPSSGLTDATLTFAVPVSAGSYEFRFFAADTLTRLATSTTMVVSASSASVSVNSVAAPSSVTVAAGSQAVISVSNGPANVGDWVGLYAVGQSTLLDFRYLNDTAQLPASGVTLATLHFGAPTTAGTYEFRFFSEGGGMPLASSGAVVVPQTTAQITVNGVGAPSSITATPGSTLSVVVTGGPANPTDYVALAAHGAPDGTYVAWQYLNGSSVPPTTGLSGGSLSFVLPSTAGTYELRLYAHNSLQRITTSGAVVAGDEPPNVTVNLTSPFPGTTFNAPPSVLLAAAASITGGTIDRVDFYSGATLIGSAATAPYQAVWLSPPQGGHSLTAVAVDSANNLTSSSAVSIAIAPAGATEGTLGSPVANPPGGVYSLGQAVTLSAADGTTIRYTVDGSEPTETSALYQAPVSITQSSTIRARAFQAGWTPSEILTAAYAIDTTPPTITAAVAPSANGAGWHNVPVTITFACGDDLSVSVCPAPVTVTNDGANQLVTGVAVDSAGNQRSVSLSISLDRTPPSVEIPSEVSGDISSAAVSFDALVDDALSGVAFAACNGITSSAINNPINCGLTLQKGRNVVVVTARDAAGNVSSDSTILRLVSTALATSITISPATAGMIVGETRTFNVRDDQARTLNATWISSAPEVVDFVEGIATAIAPGEATLTATASGHIATTTVMVYEGPFMPAGAVRWSNPSIGGGPDLADTVFLSAFNEGDPSLLSIEYTGADRLQPLVRALDVNGSELWTSGLPMNSNESVYDVPLAHPTGGVVAIVGDFSGTSQSIVRASWSDGVPSWRRDLPPQTSVHGMKLASDGTIYVFESPYEINDFQNDGYFTYTSQTDVVAIDGGTGDVKFRKQLPTFTTLQGPDLFVVGANIGGLAITFDDFVYLTTTSGYSDAGSGTVWRDTELLRISPTGETVVEQLWEGGGPIGPSYQLRTDNIQADGAGGVFFQMTEYVAGLPEVTGHYRSPTYSNNFSLPENLDVSAQITSIDSKAVYARGFGETRSMFSFDMRTGAVAWEFETSEQATLSLPSGGAVLVDGLGGYRAVDSAGATESSATLGMGIGPYAYGRFHLRGVDGTLKAVTWMPLNDASYEGFQSPPRRKYGIMGKAYNVGLAFKHLALAIVPRNQAFWTDPLNQWHLEFQKNPLFGDLWTVTTGGGPHTDNPLNWKLSQFFNKRDGDFDRVPNPGEFLRVPPQAEDNAIGDLLLRSRNFPDAILPYEPNPTQFNAGYNSNSFLRGLLNVTQLPAPDFFHWPQFPGAQKPVPANFYPPQ